VYLLVPQSITSKGRHEIYRTVVRFVPWSNGHAKIRQTAPPARLWENIETSVTDAILGTLLACLTFASGRDGVRAMVAFFALAADGGGSVALRADKDLAALAYGQGRER
jgi:hypothetical protein